MIFRHINFLLKLLLDNLSKSVHFSAIPMNEDDILCIKMPEKINYSFSISMCWKWDILNLHFDLISLFVNIKCFNTFKKLISNSSLNTITRYNNGVSLIITPFFKHLHGCSTMQHTRCSKQNIRSLWSYQWLIKRFDFFELKYAFTMFKFFLDFLILPVNKKLVVCVGFLDQTCWEINWWFVVCSAPVCF